VLDAQNPAGGEYQLHPHYHEETPFDALRLKLDAGRDEFEAEKDHDRIAAILAQWSAGLLASPRQFQAFERVLAADFQGTSPRPIG